jgi:23S rRNA pseudouridine1911/1915/1917 synthase
MIDKSKRKPHSQSNPLKFKVDVPSKLMEYLMKKMDGISRTKVKHMLANGIVSVDGERTSQFDFELQPGMTVELGKPTAKERFHSKWLKIVYEDKYLVVIDKKEGLLTNSPTKEQDTAQSILNQYFIVSQQRCRAHTIHRLDRDTSGLMLFAKDKKVAMMFEENWKETVYDRRYIAVVEGRLEPRQGTVESWLKDNKMFVTYSSPTDNGGKFAVTHYQVLVSNSNYSLVDFHLETGRKNQIRVHAQDLGHPIVGDEKYGSTDNSLGRLCLHAYRLCFHHPLKDKDLEFETPFPKIFEKPFPQR